MICKKCGASIANDAKFCEKCGAEIMCASQTGAVEASKNQHKKLPKRHVVSAAVAGTVLLIAATLIVLLVSSNRGVNAFAKQIKARNYEQAYWKYENLTSENQTKANTWMKEYITDTEEKYYDGSLDYTSAQDILREMTQFDAVYDEISEASHNIYLDNESSMAFQRAKDYAESKNWRGAYQETQNIHIRYRLYDEVTALRDECAANYRASVLAEMETCVAEGKMENLEGLRDDALSILPDDAEIIQACQGFLDDYATKTLADAETMAEGGDYSGAIELLEYANYQVYACQKFTDAIDHYNYQAVVIHCEAEAAQGNYLNIVSYLQQLVGNNPAYNNLLAQYAEPLIKNTLATAKAYADNRQFQQAIDAIEEVQLTYDCTEFQDAIAQYTPYLPCRLADCHIIESNYVDQGNYTDCFGKTHEDAVIMKCQSSTDNNDYSYAIYNLDAKYVSFAGSLTGEQSHLTYFISNDFADSGISASVKIYLDGELCYESKGISRTTEEIQFNIDVTGVKQLRIEMPCIKHSGWLNQRVIVDATLA